LRFIRLELILVKTENELGDLPKGAGILASLINLSWPPLSRNVT
jgi:hypothetical protein